MAMIAMTLVGNLVADPEIQTTQSGRKVARFRVATNDGYYSSTGEYVELPAVFNDCEAWAEGAEAAAQMHRGAAVIVVGEQRQQNWQAEDGSPRSRRYVHVNALGIDLARRTSRTQGEQSENGQAPEPAGEWAQES